MGIKNQPRITRIQNPDFYPCYPWLILLLDRAFLLLPQIVPTQQRCRVFDSFCLESDHRTGGRMFGLSRTVGDNHLVTRKLVQVVQDFAGRDEL